MSAAEGDADPLWPRLAALFEQLVELPAAEHAAHIAALRGESAELAARLQQLLAAHARSDPHLERGAAANALTDTRPPLAAGDRVGPWTLQQRLGQGGMGEVWRAFREDGELRQDVALKRIRDGVQVPELRARFLRERGILARLAHPHIARFLDAGVDAQGAPWLAMEFIDGEPLRDYCERRALAPRERVRLLLQVLDALDHAHRLLVVHRDLKPGNVLVDAQGAVKLLDFGIAKLLDSSAELTQTRAIAPLTPRYAAPEQLAGEPVGTTADVYSAGVLLFELLSGRSPFADAASLTARDHPASLWATWCAQEPATAPARYALDAAALRRQLRGELQQILSRALATSVAERYPSARAFADDLQAWLDERPLLSRPTPLPRRLLKLVRRHRAASAALVLALLGIGSGLAISLHQAQRAEQRALEAEAARQFLAEVFHAADPQRRGDAAPSLAELLQRGAESLEHNRGLALRSRVLLQQDLGRVSLSLDQRAQAAALLRRAEADAADADLDAAEWASLQRDLAELELAEDAADQAWQRLQPLPLPDPLSPPGAQALRELSLRTEVMLARSRPVDAEQLLAPYLEAPAWQSDHVRLALRVKLGDVLLRQGKLREVLTQVEHALPLLTPDSEFGLRLSLYEIEVEARRRLVDNETAMQRQREVIALVEARLGPDHARTLWARMMLCGLLIGQGALADADAEYAALWQRMQDSDSTASARGEALWGWGMVAFRRGEFALARQRFDAAHALLAQAFGRDSAKARLVAEARAMVQVELGEVAAGLETLSSLVAESRRVGDRARLGSQLNSQALALLAAGRAAEALPLIEESLALSAELGEPSWWGQVIHGRALRLAGEVEAAIGVIEPVVAQYREVISPAGGPRRAEAERELALALQQQGAAPRERILALLESVHAQRLRSLGEHSPLTRQSAEELANARRSLTAASR